MLKADKPIAPVERRRGPDRRNLRKQLAGMFKYGRRRQLRRIEDRRKLILLDHYPKPLLAAAAVILMLSIADAVMTLFLIGHGAVELNPIMDLLIKAGPHYFITVKYGLTAAAVTIILLLNHYPVRGLNMPARSLLGVFTLIFSAVIVWQLFLVTQFVL